MDHAGMDHADTVTAQVVSDPVVAARPLRAREPLVVVLLVVLADLTLYRGHGYAGFAALLLLAPLLLRFGSPPLAADEQQRHAGSLLTVSALIVILGLKMIWCGWSLHILLALALLGAYGLALSGTIPYVLELMAFPARVILGGLLGLVVYVRGLHLPGWSVGRGKWLNIVFPLIAFATFSLLFILANPDLLHSFGKQAEQVLTAFRSWLITVVPKPTEIIFWLAIAWIAIGLLRPVWRRPLLEEGYLTQHPDKVVAVAEVPSPFYAACRNTLVTLLMLFTVYLVFEFKTLWFREFPPGFYYSGYAHQGAAWLTVALAWTTIILSLVFRGTILRDPRLKTLRHLAWLWSLQNILLAVAVYHRLSIYVGFNGMTRMRIVGFIGISAVVVGFLLVLWKLARNRGVLWLMRRQLWTLALAIYLYGVLPVDALVTSYNVDRILAGDSAPSVQIAEHPISPEGVLLLAPLLHCQDGIVREGVRAYLAGKQEEMEALCQERRKQGWTSFQLADQLLLQQLRNRSHQLAPYDDPKLRRTAYQRFREYAYQWY